MSVANIKSKIITWHFSCIKIFTAPNEVSARLCFHRRVWFCSRGGGGGVVSQHALQGGVLPGGVPAPREGVPALGEGSGPRGIPAPGGGGVWSLQAHTQGGNWGDQVQAHTQGGGGSWGGSGLDSPDGYCCGRYASYWNAFLLYKSRK